MIFFLFINIVCDEKKKDGYVYVIVSVKGLKISRLLKGMKIIRKVENVVVNLIFEERYRW